MGEAYHYVRHVWWSPVDVDGLAERFEGYDLVMREPPEDPTKMSIQSYNLKELWVRSDTVTAFLSPFKAVLAQRELKPFTRRDMELREKVFEIYTCDRSTPFPFMVSSEPKFEVAEEKN